MNDHHMAVCGELQIAFDHIRGGLKRAGKSGMGILRTFGRGTSVSHTHKVRRFDGKGIHAPPSTTALPGPPRATPSPALFACSPRPARLQAAMASRRKKDSDLWTHARIPAPEEAED